MSEKIQLPQTRHNHLALYNQLPKQHERALRDYYQALDRTIDTSGGEEFMADILTTLLQEYHGIGEDQAQQLLEESRAPLPIEATLHDEDMHRQGKEMLLLFPLLELSNEVSQTYEPAAAEEWYEQVAAAILERTSDSHTADCTPHSMRPYHASCQHSTGCPRRIVANVLTRQAKEPDFSSLEYTLDPRHQIAMTLSKLNAACTLGLATTSTRDFYETVVQHSLT